MGRQSSVMISYRNYQKAADHEKKMEEGITKGAWSREEDRKLTAYIARYGIWNWNHMPKPAGLARSGKSCRLRWMNYLKPGLRHGNFTKQEEDTIIKWHHLLGNKWSTIALKLKGRTDNEIKNYWHTRIKKRFPKAAVHNPTMQPNNKSSLLNKVAHSNIIISQESLINHNEAAPIDHNTSSNSQSEELAASSLLDYTVMQDEFWGEDDQNSVTDNNNTCPCTDTESVWPLDYYLPPLIDHFSPLPNEFSAINEKLVAEDVLFESSSSSSGIAAEHHNSWEQLPSLEDMLMGVDFGVPFIDSDSFTSPYSSQESLANEYPFYDLWGSI